MQPQPQRYVLIPPTLRMVAPGLGPVEQPFVVFVLHTLLKHPYWRQPGGAQCRVGRFIRDSLLALGEGPVWALPAGAHAALVECVGILDLDPATAPFLLDHCDAILSALHEPPAPPAPPASPKPETPPPPKDEAPPVPASVHASSEANGG